MHQQLTEKLAELRTLFEQATCDGKAINFDDFDDEVGTDIDAALYALEQMVRYVD